MIKFLWCGRIAHRPVMRTFGGVQEPGKKYTESPCFLVGYYIYTHDQSQCYTCRWEKMGRGMLSMARDPRGLADSCPMAEWPVNPYVVSLLIALAQAQEDLNTSRFGRTPTQKVRFPLSFDMISSCSYRKQPKLTRVIGPPSRVEQWPQRPQRGLHPSL